MPMRKFLLLLLVLLPACSPLTTNSPPPSPQAITISYTATFRPWADILHQCAIEHPEIALIILETSLSDPEYREAEIALWLGEPIEEFPGYAASLGTDEIVVIAGEGVNLQNLSQTQLRQIYSDPNPLYQTWTYGDGNDLRLIFDEVVMDGTSVSPESQLSPNPAAMLEAIQDDPQAIGYIPDSWLTKDANKITLEGDLRESFAYPVIALTKTKPQGYLHSFLVCVQDNAP